MSDLVGHPEDRFSHKEAHLQLQTELAVFGQSTVMVAVEPDTTVYSEDTEVSMETDASVQRFRCKQLKAELDILAQKNIKSELLFLYMYFSILLLCY